MTSKSLFFKLMKADLKSRIWAIALISVATFFAYPVVALLFSGYIKDSANYAVGVRNFQSQLTNWLGHRNGFTVFYMIVASVVCGLSSFSYLYSKSKVDFFHGIPVKREKLFFANFLNGIIILVIPYIIGILLTVIVGMTYGASGSALLNVAFPAAIFHLIFYVLMYSVMVLSVMLTGNLVISFLGGIVLNFYIPIAVSIIMAYFQNFFETARRVYDWKFMVIGQRMSPIVEYILGISNYQNQEGVVKTIMIALVASLVLMILGCMLYGKRPSESAGKAMVFSVTKPIIRVMICFVSAIGLGLFFYAMNQVTGWAIFGLICGAVVSHCVIEIIYNFDFKKLFSHKGQLVACILVAIGFFTVFRYDLIGYDSYIPKAGSVKEASINAAVLNEWVSYGGIRKTSDLSTDGDETSEESYWWSFENSGSYIQEQMHYTNMDIVSKIAQVGIDSLGENQADINDNWNSWVTICYTLNSGRKVERAYRIPMEKIQEELKILLQDDEFLQGTYPILKRDVSQVAEVSYLENKKTTTLDTLTEAEKSQLLETYKKDFVSLTMEKMQEESPVGLIRFTSYELQEALEWAQQQDRELGYNSYSWHWEDFDSRDYYPIYPSFTDTISALAARGVIVGEAAQSLDITQIDVYPDSWRTTEKDSASGLNHVIITDAEEINQLKNVMVDAGLLYYDPLFVADEIQADVTYETSAEVNILDMRFPKGKVPDFLKEKMQ